MRKRDYEESIRKVMNVLRQREDHPVEEIDSVCKAMPIRIIQDCGLFAGFCLDKGFSLRDSLTVLTWVMSQADFLNDIRVSGDISYEEACRVYGVTQTNTIIVHRLNYFLHECMLSVGEILERDGRLRFSVKKAWNKAEGIWNGYYHDRRRKIEDTAWYTLSDHLRLSYEAVSPFVERVYEAIRDYMIGRGMRDVELKGRCAVVFLMGKVAGHSFRHLFEDIERESGADYSRCFSSDDLYGMVREFAVVCNLLGIRTEDDSHGYLRLCEFDPEKSQRFLWAWDGLIKALRDDDLMDRTAREAIGLNPDVEVEYREVLAEEERRAMDDCLEELSVKYKVKRL